MTILGQAGIFPADFAEALVPMVKFRNVLVHDYADLDLDLVYDFLTSRRQDLRQCLDYLSQYYADNSSRSS